MSSATSAMGSAERERAKASSAKASAEREGRTLDVRHLGLVPYAEALALQRSLVDERRAGHIGDTLLLLEHPHVITLGVRGDGGRSHLLASSETLAARGVEVHETGRGGDITYHGPGQLVGYPILRLGDRGLLVRPLVAALEAAMIETCARLGVEAARRDGHPGCWIEDGPNRPFRKIGALGLRIERGVSYHGIALNIDVELRDFDLIDPCGEPGLISTSVAEELGRTAEPPSTREVERAGGMFAEAFGTAIGARVAWLESPVAVGA